ncbi:MAG: hypothetical protein ACTSU4_07485 [Promethearchaeota archaeon]
MAKFFLELEENDSRFNYLKDVSFYKAIDYGDLVILLIGRGDKLKITSELIDMIKETYEIDNIILVENSKKPRPVVESLIYPSKLISLNEIFLATGDIEFKAVIRKEDQDQIPFTKEELEELIFELTNQTTRIEFQ